MEKKAKILTKEVGESKKHKCQKKFIVNSALCVLAITTSISGLLIQFHYHLLKNPAESIILSLNRTEWNVIHVWNSVGFLLATICHVWAHRKWYENVLKRNLFSKHGPTITLTCLMIVVGVSGFTPLLIFYFGGNSILRFSMIEIHDKIAIPFFVMALLHTTQRLKWYFQVIKNNI